METITVYKPGDRISAVHQELYSSDSTISVEVKCTACGETDDFPNDHIYTRSEGEIICPYTLEMPCQYCDGDGDIEIIRQSITEELENKISDLEEGS